MEPRRQRLSQRRRAAECSAIIRSQSEVRQDSTASADLFRPHPAAAIGASPSDDAGSADPDAVSMAVGSLPVPCRTPLAPVGLARPIDATSTIAIDSFPARSGRRVKRFAVLGALTVVGVATSMSLITPHRTPIAVVDTGGEAPVAVIPASDPGSSASQPGNDHPAPVIVPIGNAESDIPSAVAPAPKPRVTRNAVTQSRPKHDGGTVTPQPDHRAASAETYLRSRAAELGANDQRWKRLTAPRP